MAQQPVNDDDLNLIYNATDVGINTSSGEGWGLISFEHAATGAPQLVPAHSACEELWTTVDTVLPIRSKGEHVGLGMLRKFVEPDDIAATLENLYSDKQFRREQAQKAYANATQEAYKWDRIAAEWDDLLQRVRLDSASVRRELRKEETMSTNNPTATPTIRTNVVRFSELRARSSP